MKHALFGTPVGRAMVAGVGMKLVAFVARLAGQSRPWLGVLDNVASLALVAVGAYLFARFAVFVSRRLLWRVRSQLIASYLLIGFVPAILIATFFLLGGLLLFSSFSSYLVQSRLRALSERAQAIARSTAADIQSPARTDASGVLARRRADAAAELPGLAFALVPVATPCGRPLPAGAAGRSAVDPASPVAPAVAGEWRHAAPPVSIPEWVPCDGFTGLLATAPSRPEAASPRGARAAIGSLGSGLAVGILVRAVSFLESAGPSYAVVVDLPIDTGLVDRLKQDTGVALTSVRLDDVGVRPLAMGAGSSSELPGPVPVGLPLTSAAFLDAVDWSTGRRVTLYADIRMNVGETYDRIVRAEGEAGRSSFGRGLLIVLFVVGVLFLLIEALAFTLGVALARSMTGSVHELFAGTERVRLGDFTEKIAIRAQDQLGALAHSFNSMTASIENLLREQAEKKRLEEELRIAHDIQASLLPQGPIGMPGLAVTAISLPAREVGGDYYDVLPLDHDRVGVLIADVSGKGTSAALYMAELKGLVLSLSRIHWSPRDLLMMANRILAEHLDARSFITMTYAVIDLRARTLTYARAGHTPMMYLPAAVAGQRVQVLAPDGLMVGLKIDRGETFDRLLVEETLTIHSGDLFVLFTDGITEAMDTRDECFGEDRLGQIIEAHAHLPSDELRERILREIAAFVGEAPQHDDMTMILLRIGDPEFGRPDGSAHDTASGAHAAAHNRSLT